MSTGRGVPGLSSVLTEEAISFCTDVIDSSGVAEGLERLIKKQTGRPRQLRVRAIFVALLLLATDDHALHLKAATKLLFCKLPVAWRAKLGVTGEASGRKAFLARYRQVRYLFHLVLSVIDPSVEPKDRVLPVVAAEAKRKKLSNQEVGARQARLEELLTDLVMASVKVCSDQELAGFDGSVGLDATPVPLWSRGPSKTAGRCASDPDGGWYIRKGDHREGTGPDAKALRKIFWALEATVVTMGRSPAAVPSYPNLVLGLCLAKPGQDPAGNGTRRLAGARRAGWPAGYLGADRGYTQCLPAAAALRPGTVDDTTAAARYTLRALARRVTDLDAEVAEHVALLTDLTAKASPRLVATFGIGPDSAALVLVAAGDNPERMRSDAAFSMLCGASPKDASSGKQLRHRLNRSGNRAANAALHRVVLTRMRWHGPTKVYVARRTAEGKTKKEVIRCLKRYVAREIYNILVPARTTATPGELAA